MFGGTFYALYVISYHRRVSNPAKKNMPQIDFGEFFATPAKVVARTRPPDSAASSEVLAKKGRYRTWLKFVTGLLVGLPVWANMIFIAGAFIGGVFCAYQLFDRSEILRTAAVWPREFLYSRPLSLTQPAIDVFQRIREPRRRFVTNSSRSAFDRGANRFGRENGLPLPPPGLEAPPLNNPAGSSPAIPSGAGSLPAEAIESGRAAASSAERAKKADANRTVRVITTPGKCAHERANKSSKNATQKPVNTMAKSTAPQQIAQNSQRTSGMADATRNQGARNLRSANNVRHQSGTMRGAQSRSMSVMSSGRAQAGRSR